MLKKIMAPIFILILGLNSASAQEQTPPFLIMGKIPHLTGLVKLFWDDEELKLSQQQQVKLLKIRKNTMSQVGMIKKSLLPLEKAVASKILSGSKPEALTQMLQEIATLKVKASQVHLECVYATKKVLSQSQVDFLLE